MALIRTQGGANSAINIGTPVTSATGSISTPATVGQYFVLLCCDAGSALTLSGATTLNTQRVDQNFVSLILEATATTISASTTASGYKEMSIVSIT